MELADAEKAPVPEVPNHRRRDERHPLPRTVPSKSAIALAIADVDTFQELAGVDDPDQFPIKALTLPDFHWRK
jgi:hypothetical protein